MFEIKTGVWTIQSRVNDGGSRAGEEKPTSENTHPHSNQLPERWKTRKEHKQIWKESR